MPPRRSKLLWLPRSGVLPTPIESDDVPIAVLHGTLSSPGNFQRAAEALQARGRRVVGLEYGDRGTADLGRCAREVSDFLAEFERVDVLAHSLGGFLALKAAHGDAQNSIRHLVGLGAAWRGVPRTRYKRILEWVAGPALGQIMGNFPAVLPPQARVVSIVSDADTVVPRTSSELGEVIRVHGVHHAHIPKQIPAIFSALQLTEADTP
ncbi:alpha/beta fold hydrolase [Corynebacterium sp. H128]|uniref:esterase/lipase family protein n=1 Tax=Corynebacterium sp. H128 TaxID=3133427 RepID=UPI0030AE5EA2